MKRRDFYVGYQATAPAGIATWLRGVMVLVIVLAIVVPGLLAVFQRQFDYGTFEFGISRTFEGTLLEEPLPILRSKVSAADGPAGAVNHLLVGFGKFGIPEFAKGHHGKQVRFNGSLIYRDSISMIEMNDPESLEVLGTSSESVEPTEILRDVELVGELVDSKCFLGVMRPAVGKVHRACAIRCLSGGIPPALLVRGKEASIAFLLVNAQGRTLDYNVEWAGREVDISGQLERRDNLPVIKVSELRLRQK